VTRQGTARSFIPVAQPVIGELETRYVLEALSEGQVSSRGRFVTAFEEQFAAMAGARYGVATCNGTCALHLALLAAGIGRGDEVLVPSLTFVATANAVRYVGGTPVFVDILPTYWGIDPDLVSQKITAKTRAIIPVHLYGHPVEMDSIIEIARENGLAVIEDAAEAHGATYKGRPVGALGTAGIFSFFGNKIMTTGEGGMLVTNDALLAERARQFRDHGSDPVVRYWHPVIGYNYRMTNLQAALGLAQLEQLDGFLVRKREIANLYHQILGGLPGLVAQSEESWASPVYWMVSFLVKPGSRVNRDLLMQTLKDKNIETRPFFHPMHTLPPYQGPGVERCPVAEEVAGQGINLPSGVPLTDQEVERVAKEIRDFCLREFKAT
jgi:perosamine synthetase